MQASFVQEAGLFSIGCICIVFWSNPVTLFNGDAV